MEMDQFDISENEVRIIGISPEEPQEPPRRKYWVVACLVAIGLLAGIYFLLVRGCEEEPAAPPTVSSPVIETAEPEEEVVEQKSYVEISDTMINNVSLHRFIPINAKPKLEVGLIKEIPSQYVLGAMAADFGKAHGSYQVIGAFVHQGKMMSHSKSKYGFCALLKDTVVIGDDLSTSYFEQAIEEKGDFFRQHALVHNAEVVTKFITQGEALRRALCVLDDGRLCVIDTDMSVTFDDFAMALCQYGVTEAIALMGSGAAVRWAVDEAGRRFIAGADEYDFPDVVNYIVWEKPDDSKE